MTTPTISEAARRATEQIGHAIYNGTFVFRREFAEKVAAVVQSALDSAHPAPKEGATPETDEAVACNEEESVYKRYQRLHCVARSLELRLSEAKREVERLSAARTEAIVSLNRGLDRSAEEFTQRIILERDFLRSQLKTANELLGEAANQKYNGSQPVEFYKLRDRIRTHLNQQSK